MSEAQHTPLPWRIDPDDQPNMAWNNHIVSAVDPNIRIAFMAHDGTGDNEIGEANAALIVRAVNAYDAMNEALKAAERAHQIHAKCDDCMEGAADPVSCGHCVVSWTHAYELRQAALTGQPTKPARSAVKDKDLRDRLTRAKHYLEDEDLFGDNQRINKAVGEIVGALNKLDRRGVETPSDIKP